MKIEEIENKYGLYIAVLLIILAALHGLFLTEPPAVYDGSKCFLYPDGSIDCPIAPSNPF